MWMGEYRMNKTIEIIPLKHSQLSFALLSFVFVVDVALQYLDILCAFLSLWARAARGDIFRLLRFFLLMLCAITLGEGTHTAPAKDFG